MSRNVEGIEQVRVYMGEQCNRTVTPQGVGGRRLREPKTPGQQTWGYSF